VNKSYREIYYREVTPTTFNIKTVTAVQRYPFRRTLWPRLGVVSGRFFGRYLLFNFRVYNFPGSSIPKNFVCRFSHFVVTFFPGDPNNGHIFWAARLAANIFPVLRSDKQSAKRKRITTLRFRTSIENIGTVRDYVNSTRDLRTWAREERRRWHIYIYNSYSRTS